MTRTIARLMLLLMLVLSCTISGWAVNLVSIDSQSLVPGQTGVEARIKFSNDQTLRNVGIPVQFRTVEGAAYITSLKCAWADRLVNAPAFPLSTVVFLNTYLNDDGTCKDAFPGGFGTIAYTDTLDHAISSSPVGILFQRAKLFGGELLPGTDVDGSMRMIFDVTSTQGIFEIDSTCTNPANHLLFIEDVTNLAIIPDFSKGVFTVGNPPLARDTAWSTDENTAHAVSYLPASDADGDPLQFSITAGPEHGVISGFVPATGAFLYTPDPPYTGPDSLSFEATDGGFISNTGKVRITVVDINDPPVALDTAIVTDEDVPVNAQLQGYDNDTPSIQFQLLTSPLHGTISSLVPSTGSFTYTPSLNYNGPDTLTFQVFDGLATSNPATVSITVNPINDPPLARDTILEVPFESLVNGKFPASDVDSPSFTYTKVSGPFNGTFANFNVNTGTFTYTPDAEYFGPDSIKFTGDDGFGPGNIGTVRIEVSSSDCICACWSDPLCDGELNVLDMIRVIQIIFEGRVPTISVKCPRPDADYNCDCFLDALDLVKIIDLIFAGDTDICDPCTANCSAP